jgi:hypothetical protein
MLEYVPPVFGRQGKCDGAGASRRVWQQALTSTLFLSFLSLLSENTSSVKHSAASGCTAPTSSLYSAAVTFFCPAGVCSVAHPSDAGMPACVVSESRPESRMKSRRACRPQNCLSPPGTLRKTPAPGSSSSSAADTCMASAAARPSPGTASESDSSSRSVSGAGKPRRVYSSTAGVSSPPRICPARASPHRADTAKTSLSERPGLASGKPAEGISTAHNRRRTVAGNTRITLLIVAAEVAPTTPSRSGANTERKKCVRSCPSFVVD